MRRAGHAVIQGLGAFVVAGLLTNAAVATTTAPPAGTLGTPVQTATPAKPATPAKAATPTAASPHRTAAACTPANTVTARVVALDQPFWLNRLGALQPGGMIFALERDVIPKEGPADGRLVPGEVQLRGAKRPRPLVLRANLGDCLVIHFTNLLSPTELLLNPTTALPGQTATREAGVHVMGMPLVGSILSDGSYVGANASSLVAPANGATGAVGQITYTLFAEAEGTFLLYSTADTSSGGLGGQLTAGLFGAVNVEPEGAEWFRSQVTHDDLALATQRDPSGKPRTTPDGQPLLDYTKKYPAGAKWPDGTAIPPGTPILRMVDDRREIVHSDLTALITGPRGGNFSTTSPEGSADPTFRPNAVEPDRTQPYREFTILYHEIFTAVQAFPEFNQGVAGGTTASNPLEIGPTIANGAEAFAINYGTAGISAEILASRIGVGPMGRCVDCKFEEFFLSSWATGDPAMVVDVPANSACTTAEIENGTPCAKEGKRVPATGTPFKIEPVVKATKAIYADDPTNVYHSYLNDHVKFRVLHAGSFIAHVHHLHAHQWLHTPDSDESTYLDSQLITPGTSYTMEIAHGGSGNLNKTAGDSIFHCHFYPHFAGGMWSLWRVHDVFEAGTELANGIPTAGSRALPDGEIAAGTPIPALVPIPTIAMAPMPARVAIVPETGKAGEILGYRAEVNAEDLAAHKVPGYPFFVPGVAGHRAPHPPMDFAPNAAWNPKDPTSHAYLDGGLARHILLDGDVSNEHHNQWDWSRDTDSLLARELPENGTPVERATMAYHSTPKPWLPSYTQADMKKFFEVNGLPGVSGAPFANPGRDEHGNPVGTVRRYKGADIQTDVVFSKKGWHYPQQRMITLWDDVAPTFAGSRPPEPLFFRAESQKDVIEYWMTNLVPGYYELDDFQVRTPTDILGQHIHLVKFDVLASDGAANGYNYEDGSLSPDEVRERISGIRKHDGCKPNDPRDGSFECPVATAAPSVFGPAPAGQDWRGAQTTIQRWYADPVLDNEKDDRTLRTVFTHDHFGPSTHQQVGLYAGLLVEPKGSSWHIPAVVTYGADGKRKVETDVPMGTRDDGGPTSWQGDIVVAAKPADSYREFALEFQDTALAYNANSPSKAIPYPKDGVYPETNGLITPTTPKWGWADCVNAVNPINNNSAGAACATGGNFLAAWPAIITGGPGSGTSATNYRTEPLPPRVNPTSGGAPGSAPALDLAQVYRSIERQDKQLDAQPYGPIASGSPFLYPGGFLGADDFDPYTPLLRAYQGDKVQIRLLAGAHVAGHFFTTHGLRWQFEPSDKNSGFVATQGMGLSEHFEALFETPHTPRTDTGFADYLYVTGAGQADLVQGMWGLFRAYDGKKPVEGLPLLPNNRQPGNGLVPAACPPGAPRRSLAVTAIAQATSYNSRGQTGVTPNPPTTTIPQPDGLLYVRSSDLDASGKLKSGTPIEPLALYAAAGDCLEVTLANGLDPTQKDTNGNAIFTTPFVQAMGDQGDNVSLYASTTVGLRPQLVTFDVIQNGAFNVGHNPVQTVAAGERPKTFTWYAGMNGKPAELGTTNLLPADPLMQDPLGLLGALIVEPRGAHVREDVDSRAAATVTRTDGSRFRDFVVFTQSDLQTIPTGQTGTPEYQAGLDWGSGSTAGATANGVSARTEPLAYRLSPTATDISNALSDSLVSAAPETPVFVAPARLPMRLRLAQVSGTGDAENVTVHGHVWQEEPFRASSTELGDNPLSEWFGTAPHGPENNGNLLLRAAGGPFAVTGDYLYRSFFAQGNFSGGEWGFLRVVPPGQDSIRSSRVGPCMADAARTCVTGANTVNPETGKFAPRNTLYAGQGPARRKLGEAPVDPQNGSWTFPLPGPVETLTVQTALGASRVATTPGLLAAALPPAPEPKALTAAETARVLRANTFRRRRTSATAPPLPVLPTPPVPATPPAASPAPAAPPPGQP
jgi:hypothetical protein